MPPEAVDTIARVDDPKSSYFLLAIDDDLFQMVKRPLRFNERDVQLIYLGMAGRRASLHRDAKEYHNGDPL